MHHPSFFLNLFRAACAAAALLFAAAPVAAQQEPERSVLEQQHRAQVRARYAQTSWPTGPARQGLANAIALPGWTADPLQSDAGRLTRSFRRAGDALATPSFVIESWVADDARAAQEALVDWLAGLQSDRRMPSVAEVGILVGDAGFAGPSGADQRAFAWIAFVRGNVAVRISAFSARAAQEADLAEIARAVDLAIQSAPLLEHGAAPAKPQVRSLRAERSAAVAGAAIPLTVDLEDPAHGVPHLQWIVAGPGQGYVERSADGVWTLHTTGPGNLTLTLEVTGSTGTFARSQPLAFELADD